MSIQGVPFPLLHQPPNHNVERLRVVVKRDLSNLIRESEVLFGKVGGFAPNQNSVLYRLASNLKVTQKTENG